MNWLANQPLIQKLPNEEVYMSHAGLPPQWNTKIALQEANKAHEYISSQERVGWLNCMYGESPNNWSEAKTETEKFRFTINSLTRMRYCYEDGSLDFNYKGKPESVPNNLKPWFSFPDQLKNIHWLFGHWAALLGNCSNPNAYALDTGCVWGNHLTLLRWHDKKLFTQKYLYKIN
jgi:bis(5'-nucleosyl)-tetraphosphatase (symmetrical)